MADHLCPICRYPYRPTATRCEACGTVWEEEDTLPSPLSGHGAHVEGVDSQVSALWLDDLGLPAPRSAGEGKPRLAGITVREFRFASGSSASPVSARIDVPAPPVAASPADRATPAEIKAARRAAVRQARRASGSPKHTVSDVLVMDADATTRYQLDDLLGSFGFRVRPVATMAQAALLAGFHPFAAVFVAVPPGAIDGAAQDLFERVHEVARSAGVAPPVRVLVAAQWSPVDRVRAELVGCEATLAQPASRRDVARVLDANGVVLPRDPRGA
ncbi:MAG: response regulator [Betaproteobacteria bacterium]|nr:response regulator [Betaproteobacteria bacterium]